MKYLKNMRHVYAERLFGVAVGMFIAAVLLNNSETSYATIFSVYTLMALSIIGSVILGVWAYVEAYGESNRFGRGKKRSEDEVAQ